MLRREIRHRHLQDRDVGVRIHHQQRDVGAVVEAAFALGHGFARRHHRLDPRRKVRGRGRVVLDVVVALREAVEVVDKWCRIDRAERQRRRLPVGAHDQDRPGARHRGGPLGQLDGPEFVVDEGGGAVAEVDGGQPRRSGFRCRSGLRCRSGRSVVRVRHRRPPWFRPVGPRRRPCACAALSEGAAARAGRRRPASRTGCPSSPGRPGTATRL